MAQIDEGRSEYETPPLTQESFREMMSGEPKAAAPKQGGIRPPSAGQRVSYPRREAPGTPVQGGPQNSQAGLGARAGSARILNLPTSLAPGEPGSRFNPVVREREQVPREPVDRSKMVPSFEEWQASQRGASEGASQESVAQAATSGFTDGFAVPGLEGVTFEVPGYDAKGIPTPEGEAALQAHGTTYGQAVDAAKQGGDRFEKYPELRGVDTAGTRPVDRFPQLADDASQAPQVETEDGYGR